MFDKKFEHPACGMIRASRVTSGGGKSLFGSDLKHRDTITLTIAEGCVKRELNQDLYFADKDIIEVEMSYSQWGQLICSMNVGMGVPCTITMRDGRLVEDFPEQEHPVYEYDREMQEQLERAKVQASNSVTTVKEILQKQSIGKKDREQLIALFESMANQLDVSSPFIERQFREKMEQVVSDATIEVEAFVNNKLVDLGVKGLIGQTESPLELKSMNDQPYEENNES